MATGCGQHKRGEGSSLLQGFFLHSASFSHFYVCNSVLRKSCSNGYVHAMNHDNTSDVMVWVWVVSVMM